MNIFVKTLFRGISPFNGEVKVVETFGVRKLIAAGYTQSKSLNKDGLTGFYWDGFLQKTPHLNPDSRILILGVGGGTVLKQLTKKFGPVAIDAVEIDPLMIELARKYFDLKEKNVNIINTDALKFVKDARFKYDLICVDLFANGDVAVGTESKSFFQAVKSLLKEDGVVTINKLFTSKEVIKTYLDFLHEVFSRTETLFVRNAFQCDNVIVYCYQ